MSASLPPSVPAGQVFGLPGCPLSEVTHPLRTFPDPIPGVIDFGSICTFAGASGVGKTTMLLQWAVRWRDGKTICGRATNPPTGIGIISGDRRRRAYLPLLAKIGWLDIPHYSLRDDPVFNWLGMKEARSRPLMFGNALDRLGLPPGGLVIVDPLALFVAGRLIDYHEVAIGLGLLDQQLRGRQLTMLGVFHIAKQWANASDRTLRPQDRILGSMGQIGFSDTPIFLMGPEDLDTPFSGLGWTPHNEPGATFYFGRNEQGLFVPHDENKVAEASARAQTLLPLIPIDGIRRADLVALTAVTLAVSPATAYRYIDDLIHHQEVVLDGEGFVRRKVVTVQ